MTFSECMDRAHQLEQQGLETQSERTSYWLSLCKWDEQAIDCMIEMNRKKERDDWLTLFNKRNELKQRYNVAENRAKYQAKLIQTIVANP